MEAIRKQVEVNDQEFRTYVQLKELEEEESADEE